jgi:hypothetical protein
VALLRANHIWTGTIDPCAIYFTMDKAMQLYLAWLVPSSVSFLASCSVIYYILARNPKFRKQIFHQVTLFLAFADLVQCVSWFIGE